MINFPANASNGQTYIVGSVVYQYSTSSSRWKVLTTTSINTFTAASFDCSASTATGYLSLAAGTSAQRIPANQGGDSVYSTSTGIFSGAVSTVHVFTSTGTSYFTASIAITVAYLIVGGGGGGGGSSGPGNGGGGGGAGGVVTGTFAVTAGTTYTVSVGI